MEFNKSIKERKDFEMTSNNIHNDIRQRGLFRQVVTMLSKFMDLKKQLGGRRVTPGSIFHFGAALLQSSAGFQCTLCVSQTK